MFSFFRYKNALGGATPAAATSAGLSRLLGWETMLELWGVPALLALVLWHTSSASEAHGHGVVSGSVNAPPSEQRPAENCRSVSDRNSAIRSPKT
jgi:cyanate permease